MPFFAFFLRDWEKQIKFTGGLVKSSIFKYDFFIINLLHYFPGLLVASVGILAISAALPAAFGHGLGGDQAPAINFEGMNVTVRTDITPYDLAVESIDDVNLKIRFFDLDTDDTLEQVAYRVTVWKAQDLLAQQLFFDDDGVLYVEVRPNGDCDEPQLWRCTVYGGSAHPSAPGALHVLGTECNDGNVEVCARPTITGPLFDRGGLYNIKIDIEGATSPKVQVAERLTYDTFVSIAQEHAFTIRAAHAEEIPVVVKTYYDDVSNFAFDPSDNSITFDMPFDWDPDYVSLVPVVHEEIQVPSIFAPYSNGTQFKGYVDGIEVDQRAVLNDPFTMDDTNIIHFIVPQLELERINAALGPEHHASKNMNFRLVPIDGVSKSSADFYLDDLETFDRTQTSIRLSWDGAYGAGQAIPFDFAFFDSANQPILDVFYQYFVFDQSSGQEALFSSAAADPANPFISAPEGIDIQDIHFPAEGLYRIDVLLAGTGLDFDTAHSGIGSAFVEIGPAQPAAVRPDAAQPPIPSQIPEWVKSSTALWTEGSIDDGAFIQAIQFLVRQGIIDIPQTDPDEDSSLGGIPEWVKSSTALWTEGSIDDGAFIQAIQFLVRQGIIAV